MTLPIPSDPPAPDEDLDAYAERMLIAALGGRTPHQALLDATRADPAGAEGRAAAIAKNRERALKLLAALEKSQGKP